MGCSSCAMGGIHCIQETEVSEKPFLLVSDKNSRVCLDLTIHSDEN